MNIGQIIVIGLSAVLALWFLGGTLYNRRRARQIWRWLEAGLDVFGGRVGTPWISASGAGLRVAVDNTLAPFRRLELIVRLESRENLPLWLFERVKGRRDLLTLRAWLRSPGRDEIELVPSDSALDRALQAQAKALWQRTSVSSNWLIAHRGHLPEGQFEALRALVATYSRHLQRFSRRRSEPHLLVQVSLQEVADEPSQELLKRIKGTVAA